MIARHLLGYGLLLGAGVLVLRVMEYHFIITDLSIQIYLAVIAVIFTFVGIWITREYTSRKHRVSVTPIGQSAQQALDISKREMEVLILMAEGYSNKEIADKLFVSPNTVKTHTAKLYAKLEVRRRTQAVNRAKELDLISR